MFAADLQEEMAEQRFPFRQLRRRRRQPSDIAASGASNQTERNPSYRIDGIVAPSQPVPELVGVRRTEKGCQRR